MHDDIPKAERRTRRKADTHLDAYDDDELEALRAVEQFKRANRRPFPALSEVLAVLRALGWRKTPKAVDYETLGPELLKAFRESGLTYAELGEAMAYKADPADWAWRFLNSPLHGRTPATLARFAKAVGRRLDDFV